MNDAQLPRAAPMSEYEFTSDWFSKNVSVWSQIIAQLKPTRILEIGSYEGRSTCYLIESCSRDHAIEVYAIDSWEGSVELNAGAMREVEHRFDANVAIARQRAAHPVNLEKLKKRSSRALVELIARQANLFDFIYIDGSHQAPDVLTDSVLAFQLLRVGGVMIWDDYLWYIEQHGNQDLLNMPKMAIDSFINNFQRKLRILKDLPIYQLCVEKTAP